MNPNQTIKELTLMLLYLTAWTDKEPQEHQRSWKGYDFDTLNELAEDGFISDSRRSKSVVLFDSGIKEAKELLEKYGFG